MENNVWGRKEELSKKAISHTEEMKLKYADEIENCCKKTIIYGGNDFVPAFKNGVKDKEIIIEPLDSVAAIHKYYLKSNKIAVLNFASYKNPGGKFLNGSAAQEEFLCHNSYLYNILSTFDDTYYEWNRNHKNRALYLNRGLYTPNVRFEFEESSSFADVITVAAPNYGAAKRYGKASYEENLVALVSRINFVMDIISDNNVDTVILGAFGCGVFRQNPIDVATIFKMRLKDTDGPKRIIFAIPPDKNYEAFKKIFEK